MEKFDVVVIGGGPGGYPAAIRAAQRGRAVALIEREALGGTCLNWGCIPTKTLIAGATLAFEATHAQTLGLDFTGFRVAYDAMAARKDNVVSTLRNGIAALLTSHGVTLLNGEARFEHSRRLSVAMADGGRRWIEARTLILAAGSTAAIPGFLPKSPRIQDSRAFLDRTDLPRRLLIMGGGVIGCEFACMAAQLGTQVTVVELLPDILPMTDTDIRRVVRRHMESTLGIRILTGEALSGVTARRQAVSAVRDGETLEADLLLCAVGRRPDTAALELDRAGIRTEAGGAIPVDARMGTKQAGIFAVGDATAGSTQLAHAATAQGLAAAENACGAHIPAETLIPSCIFTTPEIGAVGLTEAQAAAQNLPVKTGRFAFASLGKALASGHTDGFVKWLADPVTNRLLGAHAVGAQATEWIAEAALAIRHELTVHEVAQTVHSHPTMSEAWMEAAHALHGECVHQPPPRKKP